MADGGIVVIKFEADTTELDKSIKEIEKKAKTVESSTKKASKSSTTKAADKGALSALEKEALAIQKMNAQAEKMNAHAAELKEKFKEAFPSMEQTRLEASKIRSEASRMNAAFRQTNPELEKLKLETAKVNAEAYKTKSEFKAAHPEIEKNRTETSKLRAEAEKMNAEFKLAHPELEKQRLELEKQNLTYKKIFGVQGSLANNLKKTGAALTEAGNKGLRAFGLMNKSTSKLNNTLKTTKSLILSTFSVFALFNFAKSCVQVSSDLQEVQNIVDTAFPTMTKDIEEFSKISVENLAMSQLEFKKYIGTFGLLVQSSGFAEEQAYKISKNLTSLTADIASIMEYTNEYSFSKLKSGVIAGQTRAIQQLGMSMTNTELDAYAMAEGIGKAYSKMSNLEKIALRYNYVIDHTNLMQGDFVKTMYSWANMTKILKAQWQDFKIILGDVLRQVLTPVLKLINAIMVAARNAAKALRELFKTLGFELQNPAKSAEEAADSVDNMTASIGAAEKAMKKLTDGPFSELHKLAGDTDLSGGLGASDLGSLSFDLTEYEPQLVKMFEDTITPKIKEFFGNLSGWSEFVESAKKVFNEIKGFIGSIKEAWNKVWDEKGTDTLNAILGLFTSINGVIEEIIKAFKDAWESGWGERLLGNLHDNIKTTSENLTTMFNTLKENLAKASGHFSELDGHEMTWGEYLAEQFYKVTESISNFVTEGIGWLADEIKEVDWETTFNKWGESLGKISKAFDDIAAALKKDSEESEKSPFLSMLLQNIDKIFLGALALKAIGGALSAIGGALKLIGGAKTALGALKGLGSGLATAFGGLLLPTLAAWDGWNIDELVKGIWEHKSAGEILQNMREDNTVIGSLWEKFTGVDMPNLVECILGIGECLAELFGIIKDDVVTFLENIGKGINSILDKLGTIFENAKNTVKETVGMFKEGAQNLTWKKVGQSFIDNLTFKQFRGYANGGVFAPNKPQPIIMGDNKTQTEYALTEGHLRQIASMMSNNTQAAAPVIQVQIGEKQIEDIVVQILERANYRNGGRS